VRGSPLTPHTDQAKTREGVEKGDASSFRNL
jgi:hypothetical protein